MNGAENRTKQLLFYWVLFFLQFEEFQLGGISFFRLFILPASLIGVLLYQNVLYSEQKFFFFVFSWMMIWCFLSGDFTGAVNKLLLIPFSFFIINCIHDSDIEKRYGIVFIADPLITLLSLIFGFAKYTADMRFCGIHFDPNFLCVTMTFSAISLLAEMPKLEKFSLKILYLAVFLLDIVFVVLSQSRGGILTLMLIIFIYLFKKIPQRSYKLAMIIATVFIASYIINYTHTLKDWSGLYDNPIDRVLSRFNIEGGSNRDILWKQAFNYINSNGNFIFPCGSSKMHEHLILWSHNSYIDLLADMGYVFFFFFIIFFFSRVIRNGLQFLNQREYEQLEMHFLLGLVGVVLFFFLSAATQKMFWLFFIFVYCDYDDSEFASEQEGTGDGS